jgi:hypothetical protein
MNQDNGNASTFLKEFVQRTRDMYMQEWHSVVNTYMYRKLDFYCTFKSIFEPERYLNIENCKSYRIALCRLRLSNHDLEKECGGYRNISRNDRSCKFCLKSKGIPCIEDE